MPALQEGSKAPDFSLPALDGANFSLQDALHRGPVLAVFFKVSCPVCQYAFPFFERLHKAYGSQKVAIVGFLRTIRQHRRLPERVRRILPHAPRRSRRLHGLERLWPDQRALLVLHWPGWQNQDLQCRLGKSGRGSSEPRIIRCQPCLAAAPISPCRRRPRLLAWLRIQELIPRSREKSDGRPRSSQASAQPF